MPCYMDDFADYNRNNQTPEYKIRIELDKYVRPIAEICVIAE